MKKKISTYIKKFYDEIDKSQEKEEFFSNDILEFDKKKHFERINRHIEREDGKFFFIPFYKKPWFIAAASFAVIFFLGYFLYTRFQKNNITNNIVWESKNSAIDNIDSLILEDGTKVWLNVNSSLKYPQHFNNDKREVILNGEAYFEVTHNPLKPFVIHSGNINTTVVGTSFDINAYHDNFLINVTVKTGKVKVVDSMNAQNNFLITPKQQISFHKNNNQFSLKENVDLQSTIGWQSGKLVFEDKPLEEIIPILNKRFNTCIQIDTSLSYSQITANFENESLDNILQVISVITVTNVIKKTNGYSLKKD